MRLLKITNYMHGTMNFRVQSPDFAIYGTVSYYPHCLVYPSSIFGQVIGKQVPGNRPDVLAGEVKVLQLISRATRPSSDLLKLLDVFEVR